MDARIEQRLREAGVDPQDRETVICEILHNPVAIVQLVGITGLVELMVELAAGISMDQAGLILQHHREGWSHLLADGLAASMEFPEEWHEALS